VRIPTFSRQSGATTAPPALAQPRHSAVTEPNEATTTRWTAPQADDRAAANRGANVDMAKLDAERARADRATAHADRATAHADRAGTDSDRAGTDSDRRADEAHTPVVAGPKPRASLLATLGLILGVGAALLVLSGPLLGYGIGVAVLGLILSLAGIRATSRRHVTGKTDGLLGMILSLAAIVVGALALTGSLSWAGTDLQPVSTVRHWLDTRFVNRF
jgi:hypothetical protein